MIYLNIIYYISYSPDLSAVYFGGVTNNSYGIEETFLMIN